jgi:hypothetical protein
MIKERDYKNIQDNLVFKSLVLVDTGKTYSPKIEDKKKADYETYFKERKLFNGKVLVCFEKQDVDPLILSCGKANYFDILTQWHEGNEFPAIVAVNGVLDINPPGSKDRYTLLIKRAQSDECYGGWYDFPAGRLLYDQKLIPEQMVKQRLANRIKKEIGLEESLFKTIDPLHIAVLHEETNLCLNYRVSCSLSKDQLEGILESKFKKTEMPQLLKISELPLFLASNPVIFLQVFKYAFQG